MAQVKEVKEEKDLTFVSVVKSEIDKTMKYIFKLQDDLIMEATYIDNGSNKDIICVSCQTMCAMRCKFCHLTDLLGKIKVRNISPREILAGVKHVVEDLDLDDNDRPLLVSYMGAGEPILNVDGCVDSMIMIKSEIPYARFGMATMLPKNSSTEFFRLADLVKKNKIELKMHLSLHFTDDKPRAEWMPNALDINSSVAALDFYNKFTKNPVELHYTLIEGINDFESEMKILKSLVRDKDINVKFLHYKERESVGEEAPHEDNIKEIVWSFKHEGLNAEFYNPPGEDIGSSCGQFLLEKYDGK